MSLQDGGKKLLNSRVIRAGLYVVLLGGSVMVYHYFYSKPPANVKVTPVANRSFVCIYDTKRSKLMTEFMAVGKVIPKNGTIYFEEVGTGNMISIAGALIVTTDGVECPVLNGEEYP